MRRRAPAVLAVDIGTSSVRALVYDDRLRPLPNAEAHLPHEPRATPDGGAELDFRRLRDAVVEGVDRALAGAPGAEVAAAGISCFWHGLVATGGPAAPLTPVYLWSDGRSWAEAAALRRRLDEHSAHQRTGCRLHPSFWPAKIAWLRRQEARLRGPAVGWRSPSDLLGAELFGSPATSPSIASGTGLLRLRREAWDEQLLDALGIASASLPQLSDAPLRLTARWRRRWPQLAGAVWTPVTGDGAAANLGSGCFDQSRRALTIGTSAALRVTLAAPPRSLPSSLFCHRAPGGRFIAGGALSSGGNLFRWLRETLRLDGPVAPAGQTGTGELTFLPWLAGERSPGYALRATGAIAGLRLTTTPADLLRAGLEAVAAQLAGIDRDLDRVAPGVTTLVASGAGLLADPAWMRMITDATGRPLQASHAREASARGAALAALEMAELAPADLADLDPGAEAPLTPSMSPEVRQRYGSLRTRQEALYRVLVTRRALPRE